MANIVPGPSILGPAIAAAVAMSVLNEERKQVESIDVQSGQRSEEQALSGNKRKRDFFEGEPDEAPPDKRHIPDKTIAGSKRSRDAPSEQALKRAKAVFNKKNTRKRMGKSKKTGKRKSGGRDPKSSGKAKSTGKTAGAGPKAKATAAAKNKVSNGMKQFLRPENGSPLMLPSENNTPCMIATSQTIGLFEPGTGSPADQRPQVPCQVFFPGSIRRPVYTNPEREGDIRAITGLGNSTQSQIYAEIATQSARYRVVSAHLEIHYIGEDDHNGGEFVINKFKPTIPFDADTQSWNNPDKFPSAINSIAPRTAYLPAKKGAEIAFFRNDRTTYQGFSNIDDVNAQVKMEAAVVWLDGAATGQESKQRWRWTLTQTVEIVFEADSFWSKFHMHGPCGKDEWTTYYDRTVQKIESRGADVTSNGQQAYQFARSAYETAQEVNAMFPDFFPTLANMFSGVALQQIGWIN